MSTGRTTSLTLLQRARAKDHDAWRRLMELYKPLVYYWCRQWGLRDADADDVQQEVFQAVAAGLKDFSHESEGSTFRGWLKGITRHKMLDFFRAKGDRPAAAGGTEALRHFQELPGSDTPLPDAPPNELLRLYQRALQILHTDFEPKTWQAFWKAVVEGMSIADIAASLDMTQVAVRKAKSRVLRRLREELGDIIDETMRPGSVDSEND